MVDIETGFGIDDLKEANTFLKTKVVLKNHFHPVWGVKYEKWNFFFFYISKNCRDPITTGHPITNILSHEISFRK